MPYFETYAEVNVDVEEFLTACRPKEIKEVIEWLVDEGHLSNITKLIPEEKRSSMDTEWIEMCEKLSCIRLQMSSEDENLIKEIVKKY